MEKIDVLVVEDSLDDSELTEFAMLKAVDNIHLLHLKDGMDALNFIFGKKHYAGRPTKKDLKLVVLDIRLPTMSGLDVLRQIRGQSATKALPVVMLTSSRDEHDIADAYELGANSYVVKPNGFDGYLKKIGSLAVYWSTVNERPDLIPIT